jgi:two-component system phosphate regulon sensor histidine kinase PhoR
MITVLACAVTVSLIYADVLITGRTAEQDRRRASDLASTIAATLSGGGESAVERFDRMCNLEFVAAARWVGPDGATIRSWPPASDGSSGPAEGDGRPDRPASERIDASAAIPQGGRVELACAVGPRATSHPALLAGGCVIVIVGAGLISWTYRRLRRHVRPIAAIQQNLFAYASGIETQLTALTLSDSLGQVGQAWNQLIGQLVEHATRAQQSPSGDRGATALQRFESRSLRQILERLPLGVLRCAAAESISYANPAASRLLDRSGQGLTGVSLEAAIGDETTLKQLRMAMMSGSAAPVDRKRGEGEAQQTLRFVSLPKCDGSSESDTVVTVQDVSYLHEVERARDEFLYHVTHELRTPLTNIQAYAETLTKPDFDDEQMRRECYNVIVSETRRLSTLIEDILSISQLEVGSARMDVGEVDLVRLLRQMVQDNLGHADEKKVDLALQLPPKAPKIRGDKQRLSVLLNNLIGNALKYTPTGGRVTVTMTVPDDRIEIGVADTGIGIAPDDQARVFEKFYRAASEEVQQIKGTGLGLAIAREVARLHGGDVRLHSELGKGSTFTLELPRTEPTRPSLEAATPTGVGAT